jgi:hypothetical protein
MMLGEVLKFIALEVYQKTGCSAMKTSITNIVDMETGAAQVDIGIEIAGGREKGPPETGIPDKTEPDPKVKGAVGKFIEDMNKLSKKTQNVVPGTPEQNVDAFIKDINKAYQKKQKDEKKKEE